MGRQGMATGGAWGGFGSIEWGKVGHGEGKGGMGRGKQDSGMDGMGREHVILDMGYSIHQNGKG